ncbi:MAG: nitroreductase family protein [Bacteroidales bacterium]|nr:nitroreductase family protein [Bacteroidales bacterium]
MESAYHARNSGGKFCLIYNFHPSKSVYLLAITSCHTPMDFAEIILKNRSYRRFYEEQSIPEQTIRELVNYARLSASSGNIQGLKFYLSTETAKNKLIFSSVRWAYYLKDWDGPTEGERPSAYIILLGDTEIHKTIDVDVGVAAQSILLGAVSMGYGGCMIGSLDRVSLRKKLEIPDRFEIPLVIALGKPKEKIVIEEIGEEGNIEYWRDEHQVHHVPKRNLEELIIHLF